MNPKGSNFSILSQWLTQCCAVICVRLGAKRGVLEPGPLRGPGFWWGGMCLLQLCFPVLQTSDSATDPNRGCQGWERLSKGWSAEWCLKEEEALRHWKAERSGKRGHHQWEMGPGTVNYFPPLSVPSVNFTADFLFFIIYARTAALRFSHAL